jgi:glycine cleavage system H protein
MPARPTVIRCLAIGLGVVGAIALAVAAVPILGILGWVARVAVIALVPAFILAVAFSPAFRDWLCGEGSHESSYSGLRLPLNVLMHPNHAWARVEDRQRVTVGADDLVQRVLGPADAVSLPEAGDFVAMGTPLFRVHRGGRTVAVTAPATGTVTAVNARLADDPSLLNREPYDSGWAVRLEAPELSTDRRRLMQVNRAREWFREEVDRLIRTLSPTTLSTAVAHDGGELVEHLHDEIDDETWRRVKRDFFGDRS